MTTKGCEEKMEENVMASAFGGVNLLAEQTAPPLSKDELAAENAKLKKELEAMKQAALLNNNSSSKSDDHAIDNPESRTSPVQIDEQKLAEKIRGLLMEDLNKQNQRILEQQKEELQLSLLTRLQLEAEKFNEKATTQQRVDIDKAKLLRKKKKKSKRMKKNKNRSSSVPYLNINNHKNYAPVEPNIVSRPQRSQSQAKILLHESPTKTSPYNIRDEEEKLEGIPVNRSKRNDHKIERPLSAGILSRGASTSLDDEKYDDANDVFEDAQLSEDEMMEEEFEPIDIGTLDDINEATAELLRKSRELTMTVGDNEYVKGLKNLGPTKKINNKSGAKQKQNVGKKTKRKFKKKRKKSKKSELAVNNSGEGDEKIDNEVMREEAGKAEEQLEEENTVNETTDTLEAEENRPAFNDDNDSNTKGSKEEVYNNEQEDDLEPSNNNDNNNRNQLGPLKNTAKFSGKPPPDVAPLAVKLGKREWENEVARNILVLYKANMTAQRKQLEEGSRTSSSMNQSTTSSASGLLSEDSSLGSINNNAKKSKLRKRSRKKLPKLPPSQVAKPSSMMKIKYGGGAKKTHNPVQIWFAGAGNVRAVWDGLVVTDEEEAQSAMQKLTSDSKLVGELETLETRGEYFKYIAIVEAILTARSRIFERTESHWRLWRQLAVTANVFGVKYVDEGQYGPALKMLKHAQKLCDQTTSSGQDTLPSFNRYELKGFINDSMSYYYYKRGKPHAALQYAEKAMKLHFRLKQWEHVAKCHLHSGAILSKLQRHDEAIRAMGQVLKMVEDERLESGGPSSQKICLIAITYHNIAVEQLLLSRVMEACVSSQNARRLARLSLSYSNRWIKNFESTHRLALVALSTQKEVRTNLKTKDQATLFMDLSKTMYQ
jgi:hypothetical protein